MNFLIGGAPRSDTADFGLLVLRVFTGLALALAHGLGKMPPAAGFVENIGGFGFPAPGLFGWMSAIAELVGGLLLAIGLLTRPAALLIVINMSVAVLFAHAGQDFGQREKPLLFLAIAVTFLIIGSGRYSVDALLRGRAGRV